MVVCASCGGAGTKKERAAIAQLPSQPPHAGGDRGAKTAKGSKGNSKGSKGGGSDKDSSQHPRKVHKA